ncbi:hypothetical protein THAOC_05145 [Thalassiosira oceanica]|uniref:Sulfotransferase domain-containing protein n=1 Tax=Thalassiosira oceanica TaxID=159749 RepID=K0TN73_THAOC|nr:hypothetical protein THAOC_05145 [Thalassiosira oceanica]|eukprot:EJK73242.1 hypothetical protein THAOC_05145 [Thalassiosira oceanica]
MKIPSSSPSSFAAVLIGLFVYTAILSVGNRPAEKYEQRLLSVSTRSSNGLLPFGYARKNLLPWSELPATNSSDGDTAIFWAIPRSGGTTVREFYQCARLSIAHKAGVESRFGHHNQTTLERFEPAHTEVGQADIQLVNVDTTTVEGIDRARDLGLVPSGLANLISTDKLKYAVIELFDEAHRGRAIALFRHPVERLVSQFWYLKQATWEPGYRPNWAELDVEFWAWKVNVERNYAVKRLAGKGMADDATERDLRIAMRTLEEYFVVGLTERMDESLSRFNAVLRIDENNPTTKICKKHFFFDSVGVRKTNSVAHPVLNEMSQGWIALHDTNQLDVRLYYHAVRIFEEQADLPMYLRAAESMDWSQ